MNLAPVEKNGEEKPAEPAASAKQVDWLRITVSKEFYKAEHYAKLALKPTTLPAELLGEAAKKKYSDDRRHLIPRAYWGHDERGGHLFSQSQVQRGRSDLEATFAHWCICGQAARQGREGEAASHVGEKSGPISGRRLLPESREDSGGGARKIRLPARRQSQYRSCKCKEAK